MNFFNKTTTELASLINSNFKDDLNLINGLFDSQVKLFEQYGWVFPAERRKKSFSILITAFIKNLASLFSAIELTEKGLYGPSRLILRNCFEFLMIAKFCSLDETNNLLERWDKGILAEYDIKLGKHVIKKIVTPENIQFFSFWSELCQYSHASIYSIQSNFEFNEDLKKEIKHTNVLIQAISEMNYHLLNGHLLTQSTKKLAEFYKPDLQAESKKLRLEISGLLKNHRNNYPSEIKKLIKNYKLKWTLKI